jgi:hypothetical protein
MIVLAVYPEVVTKVVYPLREDGYLHPRGSGVTFFCLVLPNEGLLTLRPQHLCYDLSLFSNRRKYSIAPLRSKLET